jgi:hypothetical protein
MRLKHEVQLVAITLENKETLFVFGVGLIILLVLLCIVVLRSAIC